MSLEQEAIICVMGRGVTNPGVVFTNDCIIEVPELAESEINLAAFTGETSQPT
jgi:hypothetical protein